MLNKGRLVVERHRQRVDAIIASRAGERFDPGHGRLMKEWICVEATSEKELLALVREAMSFVNERTL
jgi:hypothetical protein